MAAESFAAPEKPKRRIRQGLAIVRGIVQLAKMATPRSHRALGRVLTSLLYEISTHDPVSLVLAPLALLAVGAAASLGPGLKAVRISPAVALEV